jgi:hypothetical protein
MSKSGGKALFVIGVILVAIVAIWGWVGFYASSVPVMAVLIIGGIVLMAVGSKINKGTEPNKAVEFVPTSMPAQQAPPPRLAPPTPAPALAVEIAVEAPAATPWTLVASDGTRYPLLGATTIIGRNPAPEAGTQAIALPAAGSSVSKAHAMLSILGDEVRVRDLGSTNGTFLVDGQGVEHECARDGDTVIPVGSTLELGEYPLSLVAGDAR